MALAEWHKDQNEGKEKRLGHLRALIAEVEHPAGRFRAVCVHLGRSLLAETPANADENNSRTS